ncbi:MAG: amidohydrolase [Firmicutes bacterium]|nr:amidohydrolase [Bacillota bacterium]
MLAITNGKIITMAGRNFACGTVLIEAGKIIAIGENIDIPVGAEVIDVQGKLVMPGLIDAHCHLGILEEIYRIEGDDLNEITDPVTPHLRAIDAVNPEDEGFRDALRGGVTTVCTGPGSANVLGGENVVIKTYGRVIDRMVVRQPAGLKVALGENPKRIYGGNKKAPLTRMATAALLRETLTKAQNYLRKLKVERSADMPERDLRLEAVIKVLEHQMPLRVHAHRADDIITAVRIAEEFDVEICIEHCTEGHKIVEELAKRQIPALVGPLMSNRAKVELKDRTPATPGILARAGVPVAIITDHPVVPIEFLSLCAGLAVKAGMSEEDALKAITINPARILGVDDRVGSLEVGKDADLIVADGPILELKTRIELVLVEGQIIDLN